MINKEKYPHEVHLYLSLNDYTNLEEKSIKNGLSKTEFLRTLIRHAPGKIASMQVILNNLVYEIHQIGVNVNQIARAANMNGLTQMDVNKIEAYCQKLHFDIEKAIDVFKKD